MRRDPALDRGHARDETCTIYGDGESSRDFCFVANAVQANLRAAS
jgi:UDP-N-acetylglucosamine 4-epimerase